MNHLPFDKPGRFWRGSLHTHSTRSDGRRDPQAVCDSYREEGYHFISLTDHFMAQYDFPVTDTRSYRTDGFTTIIGAELHTGYVEAGELWHILAVGLPLDFAPYAPGETGPQAAARALAAGAFVAAAHPNWYTVTEQDILSLGAIHAIEVYNGVTGELNDRADSWEIADILLSRGRRYFACATDDCHFHPELDDFCRGWVWVKSEELTPEALLAALKAGAFYSSTGPQIHDIQVRPGDSITIRCSPATRIYLTGKGAGTVRLIDNGITEATLSLKNFKSPYGRVTVRDGRGGHAWSNPIWFA